MNLTEKLLLLSQAGAFKPGTYVDIQAHHDSWCKSLRGYSSGDCNCDPDIYIDGRKYEFTEVKNVVKDEQITNTGKDS